MFASMVAFFWVIVRQGLERAMEAPENREKIEEMKVYWRGAPEE